MNDICLCIDLDGFRLEDDFIVREMGRCDKSCLHMGFHHYSHNRKWSTLSKKEQRTVIYVRDMVTGLTFKPRPVEFQRGSIGLQASVAKDVFALWERFKTPKQCVVAYKGGTLEKKLLIQLQVPYVNLEDFGCPKFEYLPDYYFHFRYFHFSVHCGCHLNSRFHCSMAECHGFMRWFNKNTQ